MTLEQLRIFVAVAERQHVTRAADALHLTQSAVSSAIHALEQGCGVRLFHRVGRRIELSDPGSLFLEEARAVLARADLARHRLAELAGLSRGTLRIDASQTIAGYWLPRHLVAFRAAHPGIDLVARIANTAEVARAVREGTAELGVIEDRIDDPALATLEVARDQLVIAVPPSHPWAARSEPLAPTDLAESPWVMREPGSGTRSAFETALAAAAIDPATLEIAFQFASNEAVRAACEAGGGASAMSASAAAASIEAGLLVAIPSFLPSRVFLALHHAERTPSPAASAFLASITPSRVT